MNEGVCTIVEEFDWPRHEALYGPQGRLLEDEFGSFGEALLAGYIECTGFARRIASEDNDIWRGDEGVLWPPRLDDLLLEPA